jgi:hypothetical protein
MSIQVKDGSGNLQTVQTLPAAGQTTSANSLPVVLASDQSAVPVSLSGSVATTPPANASANITQIGGTALAMGQKASAASLPVVFASDQSALPVAAGPVYGATTNRISYSGEITSATTTSALAAVAGEYLYVTDVDLFNAGLTSVLVQLVNSASTVLWQAWVPAGGGACKAFETPVGGNGQMSADTALSIVTGAGTTALYANVNGFKSAN